MDLTGAPTPDPTEMSERHGRILAALAERGLALACKLHDAAMAAEDPKQAADLAIAFHRVSRSVRQSLALEARLERMRRMGRYEESRAALEDARERGVRRAAELRQRVGRMIWTEAEKSEAPRLERRLGDLLRQAHCFEGFADAPVEAHIARLRAELGLDGKDGNDAGADRGADCDVRAIAAVLAGIQAEAEARGTHVPGLARELARAESLARLSDSS